ncbi:GGDEF domain-containing protein [Pseudomonadota bacterium]
MLKEIASAGAKLPELLKDLTAVAVARFDMGGCVLEHNRGFAFLLGDETSDLSGVDVSSKFVNPTFDQIKAPAPVGSSSLYHGIMTIGDGTISNRSVLGAVYRRGGELWLISEHDISDLERLNAFVLELNNELAEKQRDLVKANQALKRKESEITQLMLTDPLTNLPNRRHFEQEVAREHQRSQRLGTPLCLAICDIDNFKLVNDHYGHGAGDDTLVSVAQCIQGAIRETDFAARWGGEEFVIYFANSDLDNSLNVVERLRKTIADMHIEKTNSSVTISIGLAQWAKGDSFVSLIKRADQALYESKENGRNRVSIREADSP